MVLSATVALILLVCMIKAANIMIFQDIWWQNRECNFIVTQTQLFLPS